MRKYLSTRQLKFFKTLRNLFRERERLLAGLSKDKATFCEITSTEFLLKKCKI